MNKYQKAAALDLIKITAIVIAASLAVNVIAAYFTVPEILVGLGILLFAYTGYTLFKIRVDQHRMLDELNRDRK